jgi:uncharacterized SAM-binding protein YcdF (DUF218 family)
MKLQTVFLLGGLLLAVFVLFISMYGQIDNVQQSDVAVAFGIDGQSGGNLPKRMEKGLDRCIELYKKALFSRIILSGAMKNDGAGGISAMKAYLMANGIPEDRIIEAPYGYSILKTADFTAKYMAENNLSSVFIMSQYYRLFRSKMIFKRAGIGEIYWAHYPFHELRDLGFIPREIAGIIECSFHKASK